MWARWWVWFCVCPIAFYFGLRSVVWAVVETYHGYVADSCTASGVHCGNERPWLELALALLGLLLLAVSLAAPLRGVWILGRSALMRLRSPEG
jgi:hypothetical protein